ncbi:MAG: glycoside hydrolase family 36 N-terminal domain-containing protein, partial [Kiritimatiellia bacterium]
MRTGWMAALAACAGWAAVAAPVDKAFLLQTKNTTMAFQKSGETWLMVHYGPSLGSTVDAAALAWNGWVGGNFFGHRKPATYSVYGSDNTPGTMNKFGGLAVIHADGVTSTELVDAGARTVEDQPGVTHLVLALKDTVYPFFVTQHFRACEASDVIETWVEIRHDESAPVKLMRMDALALVFPLLAKQYHLLSLTGQWSSEGQLTEAPVALGQTVSMTSRSGVRSAFGNNPAFMLSIGERATETAGRVIGAALAWSGAWNIAVQHDYVNALAVNAGPDTGNGAYTLEAGRTLATPKAVLTYSAAGKGQVSRNLHRWARDHQLRDGRMLRPVLLNSWEGAYFDFNEQT